MTNRFQIISRTQSASDPAFDDVIAVFGTCHGICSPPFQLSHSVTDSEAQAVALDFLTFIESNDASYVDEWPVTITAVSR